MNNQQSNESDFIITLTIDGTEYDKVEVNVSNLDKSIEEQINRIVDVFKLPKTHGDGVLPITYCLARAKDGTSDHDEILAFEDNNGRELCFLDYDIKPGDHLFLVKKDIIPG